MAQNIDALSGVSGDAGAQPAVSSGGKVPYGGTGPSQTPTAPLGVFAPLNIKAAPTQASQLAAMLSHALQTAQPAMDLNARLEGARSEQQGETDATLGHVDEPTAQANANYQLGVTRVSAQQSAQKAVLGAYQQLHDPKSGWSALPLEDSKPGAADGLASKLSQYFNQQLGGLEKDPAAAAAIAPLVSHAMNEMLGEAMTQRVSNTRSAAIQNAVTLATAHASAGAPVFNYSQQRDTLTKLYGGNSVAATQALNDGLIQQAIATHNPHILDLIPQTLQRTGPDGKVTTVAGPGAAPSTALKISEARDSITRYNAEQNSQDIQQRQFNVLAGWDQALKNKTPIPQAAVQEAVNNHDITPEAGLAYLNKSNELKQSMDATTAAGTALTSPGPWYAKVGTQIPGAKPGRLYTRQDFQNSADQSIGKLPPQQRIGAAVQMTKQQGLTYTPLKSTLDNEPLNTAQGIKDVLGAYDGMNSIDPTVTSEYFSDPKRLAEVHQLEQLKQAGMSDDDIASYVSKHGFGTQTADGVGAKAASVNKALASWTIQGGHFWNGGSLTFSDLANPGQVQARVKARAHQLAESGICTPETCVSQAQKQVLDESYVIKLPSNHSLVIPRAANDPPVALSQPALQWWYDSQVASVAKAGGYKGNPSDLRLVPNVTQPGTYSLLGPTGLPVSRDTFTLQGITSAWLKDKAEQVRAQQQTAAGRAVQKEQARQAYETGMAEYPLN